MFWAKVESLLLCKVQHHSVSTMCSECAIWIKKTKRVSSNSIPSRLCYGIFGWRETIVFSMKRTALQSIFGWIFTLFRVFRPVDHRYFQIIVLLLLLSILMLFSFLYCLVLPLALQLLLLLVLFLTSLVFVSYINEVWMMKVLRGCPPSGDGQYLF